MSSSRAAAVVVIGEVFTDEILSDFQSLPKLGEETFAKRFQREVGGGAAITAHGLAKLGIPAKVVCSLGREDGGWIVDRLSAAGVDCSAVSFHPEEPTGLTVSVSTREDRAFFTYYGANCGLRPLLVRPETSEAIHKARHVHFACSPDAKLDAPLFAAVDRRRCRVSVDAQSHIRWLTQPETLHLLQKCDMFFPNEREAEWISGETGVHRILRSLREKGVRGVGLKLGGQGAALQWKNQEFFAEAYPVDSLDTTGAGDCFDAGFIYAWLNRELPRDCLEIANICGALSTRALGGLSAFPSREEIEECRMRLAEGA